MRGLHRDSRVFKLWIIVLSNTIAVAIPSTTDLLDVNIIENTTTLSSTSLHLQSNDGNANFTATPISNFTEDMESFSYSTLPNFDKNISVSGTNQTCIRYGLLNDLNCLEVREFDNITLWCNASDGQEEYVTWFIEDTENSETYIGISGPALRINNISRDCGLKYKCKVSFPDNTTVTNSINVIATYPPYIFLKSIQQCDFPPTTLYYDAVSTIRGLTVDIMCVIDAVPKPDYVEWKVNNQTYYKFQNNTDSKEYRTDDNYITFRHDNNGLIYYAKVKAVEDNHFGKYTCLAYNAVGFDEWSFIVKETFEATIDGEGGESGNGPNDEGDDEY